MFEQVQLSDEERQLVLEMVQRELSELPAEIHHTRTTEYRDDLRHRRRRIEELRDKLQAAAVH